jgi:hypothetical protein
MPTSPTALRFSAVSRELCSAGSTWPARREVPTFLESGNGDKRIIFNKIHDPLRSPPHC